MINAIFFGIIIKVPNNPFFLIFLRKHKKKEKTGGENQEGNFRKKVSGRKFQEENCKGDRKSMDMDFFDLSFEESLDEQLVNAILDVGRDIRRFFEGKESMFTDDRENRGRGRVID